MQGESPTIPVPAEIYARVFRQLRPRTVLREVSVEFRHIANGHSTVEWHDGRLRLRIADLFAPAPEPVQEALAWILLSKLFRKPVAGKHLDRYRRFLHRKETVRQMESLRRERGRKRLLPAAGRHHDLITIFEDVNFRFFFGLMARPEIGWSPQVARTILGHYDSAHHTIVISRLLDQPEVPRFVVEYVMYHEMLHLRYPETRVSGRRCVHTEEFRQAEALFPELEEANRWLRKLCAEDHILRTRQRRSECNA